MLAFTRLTSLLVFILSLSFLTCALPTPATSGSKELATRTSKGHVILAALVDLHAKVDIAVTGFPDCGSVDEVQGLISDIVAHVQVAIDAIVVVGVKVKVDARLKAEIVAEVVAIVSLIVNALLAVVAKFGIVVLLQLDLCLKVLLGKLDICVGGILTAVAHLLVKVDIKAIVNLNLNVTAGVLALVKL